MIFEHSTQDELLVVRCRLGEPEALDELVDRWHGRTWAYVSRMLAGADGVEETVQDLWLRVLRGLPKLREPNRFGPWIYRIARFTVMDHLRQRYSTLAFEELEDEEPADTPTDWDLPFQLEELEVALGHLAWAEREAVTLFYLEEMSISQIAGLVGIPEGTVKSRLHRARKQLKDQLENPGDPHAQ